MEQNENGADSQNLTAYGRELTERAKAYADRLSQGLDVDSRDALSDLDWTQSAELDEYFKALVADKIVRKPDITKARDAERKRQRLLQTFGTVPGTPLDFVSTQANRLNVTVNWKGALTVAGELKALSDLQRKMRIENVNLGMGYNRLDVDDATEEWFRASKALCPAELALRLETRQPFDWETFAQGYFRTDADMPLHLVVAILQKLVHQARRKLVGKKVTFHLMPVIHGPQGCGKTYLMEQMLGPIAEAVSNSDFDQITDERNMDLWNSLVIVLDEMAKAAKADIETVKHVITAETLDRRPMRSNHTVTIHNRAVLIGASNHRLDELVKDETGNRRFVELIYDRSAPFGHIDTIDFHAMWSSIQPDDADPLALYRDELANAQSRYAVLGPVQDWLENGDFARFYAEHPDSSRWGCSTNDLYLAFREYRTSVTPGVDFQSRTQNTFASELRRITEQNSGYGLTKQHTRQGNRWFLSGPTPTPLQTRLHALKGGKA